MGLTQASLRLVSLTDDLIVVLLRCLTKRKKTVATSDRRLPSSFGPHYYCRRPQRTLNCMQGHATIVRNDCIIRHSTLSHSHEPNDISPQIRRPSLRFLRFLPSPTDGIELPEPAKLKPCLSHTTANAASNSNRYINEDSTQCPVLSAIHGRRSW